LGSVGVAERLHVPEDFDMRMAKRHRKPAARARRDPSLTACSADELYARSPHAIAILMGWFFLRHLNSLYHKFNGDILSALVLGEIAHHNICHYFSSGRAKQAVESVDFSSEQARARLQPCNPFSLSAATGIPRETCRRKVRALEKQGLIERHPSGGYVIPSGIGKRFGDTNRKTLSDLLELIRELECIAERNTPGPSVAGRRA
jgi:predicted transcriptional regulator